MNSKINVLLLLQLFLATCQISTSTGRVFSPIIKAAIDGETVVLDCMQTTGVTFWQGPANLTTYTSGNKINPSLKSYERLSVDINNRYFNLIIKNVSKEDEGLYKCSTGADVTYFELQIQGNMDAFIQHTTDVTNIFEVRSPTVYTKHYINVYIEALPSPAITEGDGLTLICHYENISVPTKISWKFGNSVLLGSGYLFEYNSIHFPSIQRRQSGNYSCEVSSPIGKIHSYIWINVYEKEVLEVRSYTVNLLLLIVCGSLLGGFVCRCIIKGMKKEMCFHRNESREQRTHSESSVNPEPQYNEIYSAYYCPVQIHSQGAHAVHSRTSQITTSVEENNDRKNNYNYSEQTISPRTKEICRISNNSDSISNLTLPQEIEDSYLVPRTSAENRFTTISLHGEDHCSEFSVSSNSSETHLKSEQRYESLNCVNIHVVEHPYLQCHNSEANVQSVDFDDQ